MPDDHISKLLEETRLETDRVLTPIREKVGYPVDDADGDAFHDLPDDVVPNYIEALEQALVGTSLAAQWMGKQQR